MPRHGRRQEHDPVPSWWWWTDLILFCILCLLSDYPFLRCCSEDLRPVDDVVEVPNVAMESSTIRQWSPDFPRCRECSTREVSAHSLHAYLPFIHDKAL